MVLLKPIKEQVDKHPHKSLLKYSLPSFLFVAMRYTVLSLCMFRSEISEDQRASVRASHLHAHYRHEGTQQAQNGETTLNQHGIYKV
jgi:hypothetical protein